MKSCRLNTSCGKTALNLGPHNGGNAVAYNTVDDTSCLLSINKIHINLSGMLQGFLYGILGDLIESDSVTFFISESKGCLKMPADCLSFTVRVRCEINVIRLLNFLSQRSKYFALSSYSNVFRLEIIIDINSHGTLGKIPYMSLGSGYFIS